MRVNVLPVLAASRETAQANENVLDHVSSARLRSSTTSTPPISKQILSTLFSTVTESRRHVFVENEQDNHFLYGLVLPLVARVLAVSTPGLLVIVQLPRPDVVPEWAVPAYDGYGSNGSGSGSKSAAPTTPSPQNTTRTPSPSDDVPQNTRKSVSPDAHPGTEELIRHADKVLSTAEAAKIAAREDGSPPPYSVVQDHAALRLICNGFEVLTGKMPPPRYDMGNFTLASVAWEKAGVLEPEDPDKGVSMSFSNGMVTPTEGIAVTFSNGSLCLLTTHDPLAGLDALKVSEATPVVVFSFVAVGYASVSELLTMKPEALTPAAARVRENLEKPNFFFLEIGHAGSLPSSITKDQRNPQPATADAEKKEEKMSIDDADNDRAVAACPPILISSVPRAIPLFVNTIYQAFIDPPYYEHSEKFEPAAVNQRPKTDSPPPAARDQPPAAPASSSQPVKPSNRPQQPSESKVATKNEANGKEVISKPAPQPNFPPVSTSQPTRAPLPPVREVVRLSQGIPDGQQSHHPPVYNYPYPGHMYASNSQSHQMIPHHGLPPMQGQSVGNPYYMSGHTPPSGHPPATGHPPYPPRGYPPNGYYPQQLVPSHDSWHRVPQYHGIGHPGHPMDARRDMPAQFANRADQYGASYYPPMNEMYPSQHVGAPPSHPTPVGQSQPVVQKGLPGPSTLGSSQQVVTGGISGNPSNGRHGNGTVDAKEKENALQALMHMRSRGTAGDSDAKQSGPGGDGESAPGNVSPRRNSRVRSPVRNRRSDTASSTSANSGGGALMHGAVVGHSHCGMPPRQKRRKR